MQQWMKTALCLTLSAPLALAGCAAQSDDDESIADALTPASIEAQGGMISGGFAAKNPNPSLSPEVPGLAAPPSGEAPPALGCASPIGHVPDYQAPSFQAPNYPAPTFGPPTYTPPVYQAPQYQSPNYQAPAAPPSVPAPSYTAPNYPGPVFQAPVYQAPTYLAPTYPAPIYQAPSFLPPNQMITPNVTPQPIGCTPVFTGGYAPVPQTGYPGNVGQAASPCHCP